MIHEDKIETWFPGFLYFRSPLSLLNITPGKRKDRRPGNEFDFNFEGTLKEVRKSDTDGN